MASVLQRTGRAWEHAVRRVFVALADGFPAVFATAQVTRGYIWSGRSLWGDAKTEWAMRARNPDAWIGLPPRPTWWTWFGAPYADVAARLPADRVTRTERGVLHVGAERPTAWDGLEPLKTWIPEGPFGPPGRNPARVTRARTIPPELA